MGIRTFAWGVCALIPAVIAQADDPIFTQMPIGQPATGYFSDNSASQYYHQRVADNFTLPHLADVNKVRFWGSTENFSHNDLSNISTFNVSIFADASGVPGLLLKSQSFLVVDTNATLTGNTNPFSGDEFFHEVTFTTPVTLQQGTTYWLSVCVQLSDPFGDAWVWSNAGGDNSVAANFFPTSGEWTSLPGQADVAFQVIPAPGGIGVAVVASLLIRRRRCTGQNH